MVIPPSCSSRSPKGQMSTSRGATPLFVAAQEGHTAVVQFLVTKGADANIPTTQGVTPLFVAAQNGHFDIVQFKTSRLPGFTGTLFPGHRTGRDPAINTSYPLPPWATGTLGLRQVVVEYEEENDAADTSRELEGVDGDMMVQLFENLEISTIEDLQ
ncbi:hypothetical protein B0H11DRAFT_1903850 [Mycena galericulata]|nr:hypothetical protein B0H11DRAFT_1903850 [Mycena galericulata]